MPESDPTRVSIVIPAHNEEAVIGRCLSTMLDEAAPGELDVVVACNGCTDRTAVVAESFGDDVRVVHSRVASKAAALNAGDAAARHFPRFYVDADVALSRQAIRATARALTDGGFLAAAPRVEFDLRHSSRLVRAFYRVWRRNPYFDDGKIGSGVYAVSKAGHERLGEFPLLTADDEYVRRCFAKHERTTLDDCCFTIVPPRTLAGVVSIKTRSRRGNLELTRELPSLPPADDSGPTAFAWRLLRAPATWPSLPIYLGVALATSWRSRATLADRGRWERDASSRAVIENAEIRGQAS